MDSKSPNPIIDESENPEDSAEGDQRLPLIPLTRESDFRNPHNNQILRLETRATRTRYGYIWRILARKEAKILAEGLPTSSRTAAIYLIFTPSIESDEETTPREIIPEPKTWIEPIHHHRTNAVEAFLQETNGAA
jgi:hypothetical protein